ncbi:MAG: hypothetical protein DDG60_13305 [Anaerolineae bacterium]|nr:MAG: hypothetical protein DDG60_13305 [Anaerolineae bacterium]
MPARMHFHHPLLVLLLLLAVGFQVFDPSRVWKILIIGLGGVWFIGWLWARVLARSLRLVREMRYGWAQVGDRLEERFTLVNNCILPVTWVEVEDHSTLPGYSASLATAVGGEGEVTLLREGYCSRRGLYLLGGTTLRFGDPLGMYTVTLEDPASRALLVLPPVVPLPTIEVTPSGYTGDGRPLGRTWEENIRSAGVREYQPGDPLRRIHWPTSARRNKLYIHQLEGSPSGTWWILLDLDERVQIGNDWDSTVEHGVILAASLAERGLRENRAVGLVINGKSPEWLIPRGNAQQGWSMRRALALAQPGDLPLGEFLQRSEKTLGKHASLVMITASTSMEWIEPLTLFLRRGLVPTVLLLAADSFGGHGNSQVISEQLQGMGIVCHVITREVLNRPEARPGQAGHWQFQQSKVTGKVRVIQRPDSVDWRRLT